MDRAAALKEIFVFVGACLAVAWIGCICMDWASMRLKDEKFFEHWTQPCAAGLCLSALFGLHLFEPWMILIAGTVELHFTIKFLFTMWAMLWPVWPAVWLSRLGDAAKG